MPQVRVNGVSLYVEERGAGAPIVGIHGTGSSAAFWSAAAETLATRGRTIVYDRRGHFRSERPEPYVTSVRQHADDAAALIDALDAAPAIVIARSYGGAVAVDLTLRYPDRVRALALLEGDVQTLSQEGRRWLAELSEQVFAAAEVDLDTIGETLIRNVAGAGAWEGLREEARELFAGNGAAIVAELRGGFPDVGPAELARIVQPTLLVAGTDSLPGYAEGTELAAAAIPPARTEWVEGGHLIDPADPVVLRFVDEILAA